MLQEQEIQTSQETENPPNSEIQSQENGQPIQKGTEQGTEGSSLLTEGDGEKKPEAKQPEGAPEKYEPFKAPDSWAEKGLELDPKTIEAFAPIAKELGLTQAQAQKLVDFYTGVAEANSDAAVQNVMTMRKEWRDAVSADKNLGHRLPEVKANFSKMLNSLGDANLVAAFKEAMDLTGAGDHPAFIRAVDLWSTRFIEGRHVQGNGPSTEGQKQPGAPGKSAASVLYPNNA